MDRSFDWYEMNDFSYNFELTTHSE